MELVKQISDKTKQLLKIVDSLIEDYMKFTYIRPKDFKIIHNEYCSFNLMESSSIHIIYAMDELTYNQSKIKILLVKNSKDEIVATIVITDTEINPVFLNNVGLELIQRFLKELKSEFITKAVDKIFMSFSNLTIKNEDYIEIERMAKNMIEKNYGTKFKEAEKIIEELEEIYDKRL